MRLIRVLRSRELTSVDDVDNSSGSFIQDILDCLLGKSCVGEGRTHHPPRIQSSNDMEWFDGEDFVPNQRPGRSHRRTCLPSEKQESRCLNRGRCFAIDYNRDMRQIGCRCPAEWIGQRCEQRYIDPNQWLVSMESNIKTADVSIGLSLVVIATALIIVVYSCIKNKVVTGDGPFDADRKIGTNGCVGSVDDCCQSNEIPTCTESRGWPSASEASVNFKEIDFVSCDSCCSQPKTASVPHDMIQCSFKFDLSNQQQKPTTLTVGDIFIHNNLKNVNKDYVNKK